MRVQVNKFDIWQQSECARLGISIEEHNKILEIANNLDAAYGGNSNFYDFVTAMIAEDKLKEAWKLFSEKNEEEETDS